MTLPNEISVTAVLLSFTGGLVTGFNPCCYTAIPGTVGYLGGFCKPSARDCAWLSIWMGLGIFSANMILGTIVILAGTYFGQVLPAVRYFLASVPIFMGLVVLKAIPLKIPGLNLGQGNGLPKNAIASYLIGLIFSLAVLPCATPILASILSYSSIEGAIIPFVALLAAYGIGISIPVVVAGCLFGFATSFGSISRFWPYISNLSGIILVVLGLYLLWKV